MIAVQEQQAVLAEYQRVLADHPGCGIEVWVVRVGGMQAASHLLVPPDGEPHQVDAFEAGWAWMRLHDAMADEHGAWYRATLTIDREGAFTFGFDHTTDPTPFVPEGISQELWLDDLRRYPRPWRELPEWHCARRLYSEQTYAELFSPPSREQPAPRRPGGWRRWFGR